jgi:hypothetical protein
MLGLAMSHARETWVRANTKSAYLVVNKTVVGSEPTVIVTTNYVACFSPEASIINYELC